MNAIDNIGLLDAFVLHSDGVMRAVRLIDRAAGTVILSRRQDLPHGSAADVECKASELRLRDGGQGKFRGDWFYATAPSGVEMLVSKQEHELLVAFGAAKADK